MMVRAIRGATTVENNDATEIINETRVLLSEIIEKNALELNNVISVIFSVTNDLDAAFPAVAARQIGWTNIALMCTNEINVPGSLKKCIRILVHFNTEKSNEEVAHVYLKGARILRPDLYSEDTEA
ncbi:MAG: chorismate mutase [Clostridia bacterium]|nr:chorismate mutase [Clostridia bacterium]